MPSGLRCSDQKRRKTKINLTFSLYSVFHGALYMMYSVNHPTIGDYQNNACFYVKGEDLMLGPTCHYFIAHVPGFSRDRNTISLESYCKRGYFLRQRRYGFILAATHASLNFGKCSSWIQAITEFFFFFFKSIHQPFCPWIKRFYTRGNNF